MCRLNELRHDALSVSQSLWCLSLSLIILLLKKNTKIQPSSAISQPSSAISQPSSRISQHSSEHLSLTLNHQKRSDHSTFRFFVQDREQKHEHMCSKYNVYMLCIIYICAMPGLIQNEDALARIHVDKHIQTRQLAVWSVGCGSGSGMQCGRYEGRYDV